MRNSQAHVTRAQLVTRARLARAYVEMTRVWCDRLFPHQRFINLEALVVGLCVFIGDAERRPMTVARLSQCSGLSRQTIYRRLKQLVASGRVVREGRRYYMGKDMVTHDYNGKLSKIAASMRNLSVPDTLG